MVANALTIAIPALRPEVSIIVGAFPLCESITFPVSCLFDHEINLSGVLRLPSWFPGMAFKRNMAMVRALSKHYLERPFEYALQKGVMVISIAYPVRTLNDYMC